MNDIAECLILIVDDTEASVDLLVAALEDSYELAVALDGEAALEVAEESQPNLILLDIVMPGMSGFEVCEKLRESSTTRSIPVMFLSGQADDEDRERAVALEAVGFIEKPFDVPALQRQVAGFLNKQSRAPQGDTHG